MQSLASTTPPIRIVALENDPLWFAGLRALLMPEAEVELVAADLAEVPNLRNGDLVLLRSRAGNSLFEVMERVKGQRPDVRVLVSGSGLGDEEILDIIAAGAKGYVDVATGGQELAQAIRVVAEGWVWAPRRVLSAFVDRASSPKGFAPPGQRFRLTDQEKQVLKMLVAGLTNREISAPLGVPVKEVRSHVGRLMRKIGVQNRMALSIHAITHSLV